MECKFREFREPDNSLINWGHFKHLVSHIYLAGSVVASWSIAQEATGSNSFFCNDKYF